MRQSRAKLPQRDFVPTAIKVDFPRGRCETAPERGEPRAVEAMSASSTEADTTPFPRQVRCGSFSDLAPSPSQVRSSPNNRHAATASPRPLRAKKRLMHCTNFEKNAGTHLHDTHRAVEEPSTTSMADIGNSLQCRAPTPFTWPSKAIR